MVFIMFRLNRRMKDGHRESRKKAGELNADIEDSLLGIHVVKSFAAEKREIDRFQKGNKAFYKVKAQVYKYMGSFHSMSRLCDGLMYIVTVMVGALRQFRAENEVFKSCRHAIRSFQADIIGGVAV